MIIFRRRERKWLKLRRFACLIICLSALLPSLSDCAAKTAPEEVVSALCENEIGLGGGKIYYFSAPEGDEGYLPDDMLLSLYGFDRGLSGLSDGAIYLSGFYHPCEFAVFVCESTSAAEDVALCLRNRIDTLRKSTVVAAPFCDMTIEEYRSYIESAAVLISGRYVALIISSDATSAKRAFYRAV